MCDVDIRVLGHVQPYTIMCALPVNLFNEIIFIFIWFWLVAVSIATVCSFLYWLVTCVVVREEVQFIKSRLIAMDKLGAAPDHMIKSFVNSYLRNDGILIVQLVSENASDIVAAELICGLWDHYRDNKKALDKLSSHDTEYDPLHESDDESNKKHPRFVFDRHESGNPKDDDDDDRKRPLYDNDDDDSLKKRLPPPVPWAPSDHHMRPPIPPKPTGLDNVDHPPPSVAGRIPFRMPQNTFDPEKARKEKLEKERKEREMKEKKERDRGRRR